VREAAPGRAATDPSLGAEFTDQEVSRAADYRGPGYLSYVLGTLLSLTALLLLALGPIARLVDHFAGRGLALQVLIAAGVVTLVLTAAALPLGFVRGYAIAHNWGLSTQSIGGWISDQVRVLGVGLVFAVITALVFFALVRAQPKWWWLYGWLAFTVLTVLFTFLWPIVIAPLFNKFTPLEDQTLTHEILHLADEAGVPIKEVLVADASKRTTAENAYVAGIGASKQLVVYDTLLRNGREPETLFVVAHELGHKVKNHVIKGLLLSAVGLFVGFAALAWLSHHPGIWRWGYASGVGDVRALPLLLVFATVAVLLTQPIQNAVSRTFERQADSIAFDLTKDPDTAVRVFRRLAFSNLADLKPSYLTTAFLFTHPSITDRIHAAVAESATAP
jgi:STE24 endopeptidase